MRNEERSWGQRAHFTSLQHKDLFSARVCIHFFGKEQNQTKSAVCLNRTTKKTKENEEPTRSSFVGDVVKAHQATAERNKNPHKLPLIFQKLCCFQFTRCQCQSAQAEVA